jgi:hypothetical protein
MQVLPQFAVEPDKRNSVFSLITGLLRGSKPVLLVTAFVAVLGISGTAYAAKLVTGADIKDGSISTNDLSKKAKVSLKGDRGIKGNVGTKGNKGDRGSKGRLGMTGAQGVAGAAGVQGTAGVTGVQGAAGVPGVQGAAGTNGLAGTPGGNGAPGANGSDGTDGTDGVNAVRYFAAVSANGTLSGTQVIGVLAISHTATSGVYDLTLSGTPTTSTCVGIAQVTDVVVHNAGGAFVMPGAGGHVVVTTYELGHDSIFDGAPTDHAFVVTVSC